MFYQKKSYLVWIVGMHNVIPTLKKNFLIFRFNYFRSRAIQVKFLQEVNYLKLPSKYQRLDRKILLFVNHEGKYFFLLDFRSTCLRRRPPPCWQHSRKRSPESKSFNKKEKI